MKLGLLVLAACSGCAAPARSLELTIGRLFLAGQASDPADVLVHFHGSARVVEREFVRSGRGGLLVTVHLGAGSAVYERAFADPEALGRLVDEALRRAGAARRGKLCLSSFSAGYGAIRAILAGGREEVDGIVLADSLHAGYADGRPRQDQMAPFVRFARSGKPVWITHSAIVPGTYASTRETADALIAAVGARREPASGTNARGMRLESKADHGAFQVRGYAGAAAADHLNHLHQLGEALAQLP